MAFAEARQNVLANNIANIDTVGYKVRDMDLKRFQSDLREALAEGSASPGGGTLPQATVDFDQYLLFHDGNNRSVEKQMTAITKNSILHNVAAELLRSRYALLEKAVAMRP